MHGMEYPPGGPIRPDIIRPTGVNPVGKMEQPLRFLIFPVVRAKFLFQRSLDAARPSAKITSLTTLRWSVCSSVSGMLFPPPERVVLSASDPAVELFYTFQRDTKVGDKWLCVVVKYIVSDAFVVTAYLNDKIKKESNDGP